MATGTDRRRVNGPGPETHALIFDPPLVGGPPNRPRSARDLRKICQWYSAIAWSLKDVDAEKRAPVLKTGLTPSASGSAYLEFEQPGLSQPSFRAPPTPKLICTVHGPRPLPSSAPFSSSLVLSTYVKFATFASERRRGYLRDALERDLAVHLEAALRAVIIAERWPKSCVEVVVTILETDVAFDAHRGASNVQSTEEGCGLMLLLSGCITAASTALVHAGIDCVDVVTGGAAALVARPLNTSERVPHDEPHFEVVLDPCSQHPGDFELICVVGYLGARDEITEIWIKSGTRTSGEPAVADAKAMELLIQGAVEAAASTQSLVAEAIKCTS